MNETPQPVIPIVFVHGTRTSAAIWDHQERALREAGHPTVAVDLPGHGSRTGERFTLAGALGAIDEAVRAQDAPPLLVGLSLGGYTSLAYAAQNQEHLSGVVLSGCSTEIKGKPLRTYRRVSARVAALLSPNGTWHVVEDMLEALHGYSSLADLRQLSVPVWLVNGQRDVLRLSERRFLLHHPRARLHVVAGAGHDVNSHAPVAFNRILLRVLHELLTLHRPNPPHAPHLPHSLNLPHTLHSPSTLRHAPPAARPGLATP